MLGIIGGLYRNITIVPFFWVLFLVYYILPKNIKRYMQVIIPKKIFILCLGVCLFSYFQINQQQKHYREIMQEMQQVEEVEILAKVVSNVEEKAYQNTYEVEIQKISTKNQQMQHKKIILQVNKQERIFTYGEIILIKGNGKTANVQRNYKGFDYQQYLQTQHIYGIVKAEEIQVISQEKDIGFYINQIATCIKEKLNVLFSKEESATLAGILIGDTSKLNKETEENFRNSSLSHMLAVSRKSCCLCYSRYYFYTTKNKM